jgi:non-homologous end joining protein Ku
MVRGYETDTGKFVTISDEELERLAPEKTRDIDLTPL